MLDLLIAANAKRIAKLPKVARAGLAGLLVYTSAVGIVNLAPEKMNYVPVLSNITPVLAQVTQAGVTRTELISHTEFTRINAVATHVVETIEQIEENLDTAINQLDQELAELSQTSAGYGAWYEDNFNDEYTYTTSTSQLESGGIANFIEYSDGLEAILVLEEDNTGIYIGDSEPIIIRWYAHRNGTIVITDDKFEATFSSGLVINN